MGIGIVFTVIGWVIAAALAEIAVSCAWRITAARWRVLPCWSDRAPDAGWLLPELAGSGCLAALASVAPRPLLPALAAGVLFAVAAAPLAHVMWQAARQGKAGYAARRIASMLGLLAWTARSFLAEDLRALTRRAERRQDAPQAPAPAAESGPRRTVPAPRAAPGPGAPGVPPVRQDPALGDPGQPADIADGLAASGVAVPAHWAALADRIAAFEPADEDELRDEIAGDAAGALLVAEAIRARADTLLTVTGLDPAYVAGHADFADEFAGMAQAAALVHRRFYVIYNAIRDFVSGGGVLPHRAREFFGGGEGTAPDDGQGEADAA